MIRPLPPAPYTTAEAAHVLGVTTDTIIRWIHEGRLPGAFRSGVKLWRVPVATVEQYMQRQAITA